MVDVSGLKANWAKALRSHSVCHWLMFIGARRRNLSRRASSPPNLGGVRSPDFAAFGTFTRKNTENYAYRDDLPFVIFRFVLRQWLPLRDCSVTASPSQVSYSQLSCAWHWTRLFTRTCPYSSSSFPLSWPAGMEVSGRACSPPFCH